jgi:hypothetical protein
MAFKLYSKDSKIHNRGVVAQLQMLLGIPKKVSQFLWLTFILWVGALETMYNLLISLRSSQKSFFVLNNFLSRILRNNFTLASKRAPF